MSLADIERLTRRLAEARAVLSGAAEAQAEADADRWARLYDRWFIAV